MDEYCTGLYLAEPDIRNAAKRSGDTLQAFFRG